MSRIRDWLQRLLAEFAPRRVVLFGSHALGSARDDSDVDLLVIMPFKGTSADQSVAIRLKTNPEFPCDLLVRTPQQVQERLSLGDDFMREIMARGLTLYEATHR